MGFFNDILSGISDITGIREISPEYTREYEETKVRRRVEADQRKARKELQTRMRSKNADIRRKAKKEFHRMEQDHEEKIGKLRRDRTVLRNKNKEEARKRLAIGSNTPGSTTSPTDYIGKVQSLSRLGNLTPLSSAAKSRGHIPPPLERSDIERRPK